MKFSATDWSYIGDRDPATYYGALKAMGIDGVEMVSDERRPIARDAGLTVVNIGGGGMQVGLNRVANHDDVRGGILTAIDTAGNEGIPNVIVFSGNRDGQGDADGIEQIAIGLEPCLAAAASANVTLIFELLNAYDHEDYQADNMAFGLALLERCAHPQLKLLYDIYHMARMDEPYVQQLSDHISQIAHIHIAGHPGRGFPGLDQHIDYAAAIEACESAGFQEWYGLEFLPQGDALEELERARKLLAVSVP